MSSFLVPPVRNCVLVCVITMGGLESRSAWAQRDGNDEAAATETSGPREAVPAEMPVAQVELPDAPLFMPVNFEPPNPVAGQSASLSSGSGSVSGARDAARVDVAPTTSESVPLNECPYDATHARECRVHWPQLLISSAVFLTFQARAIFTPGIGIATKPGTANGSTAGSTAPRTGAGTSGMMTIRKWISMSAIP